MVAPWFISKVENALKYTKDLLCAFLYKTSHFYKMQNTEKDKVHALQLNHLASRIRVKNLQMGFFLLVKLAMTVGENPKQLLKDEVK